ncbi:helix-turn-helix domain-containing protein [Herbiconiux sp.]|uniref:sigma-54-dependent Fis family transcriptional regulator n=1 Tax=Herbiconiux sp. TaxID=1871186 RepID=UPI0025BFD7BD|nr:helix-turn-helix domain-containing protein [Herbiconiux sp.]
MPSNPRLDDLRDTFLNDGKLDLRMEQLVRPIVLESWKRSRGFGSPSRSGRLPFESPIVSDSVLLRAARPILTNLADELGMSNASLLVADRHARILETWISNQNLARRLERVGSVPGHSGAEELVGTNGIGTPAADKKAGMIVGAEHIADVLTDFACVGAPIHNPITGRSEGVVTLTALVQDASPILPSLINQAAREVGRQLVNLSSMRERVLFDAFLSASRLGRAVAVVGGDLLMENPSASEYLHHIDKSTLWMIVSESISAARPKSTVRLETESAITELACSAVMFDDEMIGAIVEVVQQIHTEPLIPITPAPASANWPPLADSLPGTSQAWVYAREQAESAMRASLPVVVFGAPGTGKFTLLRHMLDRVAPRQTPLVFEGQDSHRDPETWFAGLTAALEGRTPIVFRHLDGLEDADAQRVADLLAASPALLARGLVLGTAGAQGSKALGSGHQALLDLIAVGRIDMPNLRERKQDMRSLLHVFERKYASAVSISYTQGAYTALSRAPWPGNLRQLDSVMRGVFALGRRTEVTIDQLPPAIAAYSRRRDLTMLEQLEVDGIINALIRCFGNKVLAAEMLGISRSTLYRKISGYKLDEERLFI